MDASWAGVEVAVISGIGIPVLVGMGKIVIMLTRLVDGQEEFRKDFDEHVKKDKEDFDAVKADSKETKTSLGGLHARVLSVQEILGVVHHPPSISIGEKE